MCVTFKFNIGFVMVLLHFCQKSSQTHSVLSIPESYWTCLIEVSSMFKDPKVAPSVQRHWTLKPWHKTVAQYQGITSPSVEQNAAGSSNKQWPHSKLVFGVTARWDKSHCWIVKESTSTPFFCSATQVNSQQLTHSSLTDGPSEKPMPSITSPYLLWLSSA